MLPGQTDQCLYLAIKQGRADSFYFHTGRGRVDTWRPLHVFLGENDFAWIYGDQNHNGASLSLEKMERQRNIDAMSSSQPENQLDSISRATSAPFTSCATYKHKKQAQHTSLLLLRGIIRLCLLFKRLQVNNNSINPHKSPPALKLNQRGLSNNSIGRFQSCVALAKKRTNVWTEAAGGVGGCEGGESKNNKKQNNSKRLN